ncbi:MAG: DUF58 domain-containing protein [Kiritimatiellae bacterium]|nr:DUF58 domain-containing protein [Kiritimatiellia bacterium]
MKIVPTYRLVMFAVIPVLAALLSAFLASGRAAMLLAGALLAILALFDLLTLSRQISALQAHVPKVLRLTCHRPGKLEVTLSCHPAPARAQILSLGAPWPLALESPLNPLRFTWPQGAEAVDLAFELTAHARGGIALTELFVQSGSLLGLWHLNRTLPVDLELRVYPELSASARRVSARFLSAHSAGLSLTRLLGQGREFERLRDYLPGDSYADIDWKATARRRKPVTRLYQAEHTQQILVAIDAGRLSARVRGGTPVLDSYINAALFLGQIARKNGDHFGVLTFSDRVSSYIRPGSGQAHHNACRELLCHEKQTSCSPAFDELFSFLRLNLAKRTLVLILTDLDDPLLSEKFLAHVEVALKRHLVHLCMPRPMASSAVLEEPVTSVEQIYTAVAGDLIRRDLEILRRALAAKGVVLKLAEPEDVAVALVNQYLEVKQRQML